MKLEAGKEMDRKCVLDWLNRVYITPSLSYSEYTDEEIRIFAHDALVLLKEQEAVEPIKKEMVEITARYEFDCPCGAPLLIGQPYCADCGKQVKWDA